MRVVRAIAFGFFCAMGALGAATIPTAETLSEARTVLREELDLQAQQEMASWSMWMFVATLGSVGVSVLALLGLRRSLAQTATAIKDNRELGEAQAKAYMAVESLGVTISCHDGISPLRPVIGSHWRNMGNTPAFKFEVRYKFQLIGNGDVVVENSATGNRERGAIDVGPGQPISVGAVLDDVNLDQYGATLASGLLEIRVSVEARYASSFGHVEVVNAVYQSMAIHTDQDARFFEVKLAQLGTAGS